jgi:uncharacterized protein YkwD
MPASAIFPSLLLVAATGALAAPAPARADELAGLINAYRAAPVTCNGAPAVPAPALLAAPALSQLRVASGTFLEPALRKFGYRADRAEAILLRGPEDARAAMDVLRQKYCRKLLDAGFEAVGTARSGNEWQVVLAHPLVIPDLPGWEQTGQRILALTNMARAQARTCGDKAFAPATPLSWNQALGQAAWAHSEDMAQLHYFKHVQPDGSVAADRASRAGYRWKLIGENIASGQRTPEEAVASWLDSPGHCANLMNPRFSEMGAAHAINLQNDNRTAFWTQVFGAPP